MWKDIKQSVTILLLKLSPKSRPSRDRAPRRRNQEIESTIVSAPQSDIFTFNSENHNSK